MKWVAIGAAAVLSLAGCANLQSQVAQMQPVAGDALTGVNIAVLDVLIDKDVDILVAPVCSYEPETYTCDGTTVEGAEIKAEAVGAEPDTVSITVGGKQIFSGSIDEVLKKASER